MVINYNEHNPFVRSAFLHEVIKLESIMFLVRIPGRTAEYLGAYVSKMVTLWSLEPVSGNTVLQVCYSKRSRGNRQSCQTRDTINKKKTEPTSMHSQSDFIEHIYFSKCFYLSGFMHFYHPNAANSQSTETV